MNCVERRKGGEIGEIHDGGTSKYKMQQLRKRMRLNCGARIDQWKAKLIIERPKI